MTTKEQASPIFDDREKSKKLQEKKPALDGRKVLFEKKAGISKKETEDNKLPLKIDEPEKRSGCNCILL